MERLSAEIHREYRQASDKFDYFLAGITLAICGYLVQIYDATGLKNLEAVSILGVISICLFLFSLLLGFKRIEKLIEGKRKNYEYLRENERIGDITNCLKSGETVLFDKEPADLDKIISKQNEIDEKIANLVTEMNELCDSTLWLYKTRNNTLLLGIAVQFMAQVLSGVL